MAISAADFPDDARDAVLAGMANRARMRGFATPKLSFAHRNHREDLELCAPHRMALLPLSTLRRLAKSDRCAAKPAAKIELPALGSVATILGWRFLIYDKTVLEPIAAAHAVFTDEGGYRLAELNEGPYVTGFIKALQAPSVRRAISSDRNDHKPGEPLLLLAPAICFAGLWVRHQDHDEDFILPMDPNLLPAFTNVKPAEVLKALVHASTAVPTDSGSAG
ncbi:hypothetical protein FBZ93_110114 [Bradyrhizobium macuxiense]|uniref:Uncharacterized protein n=1 Tax=Bradyrhizobium macuxiense TaxID=1755647 RepID=A0A560LJQ2_9BRAD|nr:hypothetical protein [Bradyrhizobium macuxiense]TWB93510.1 hypothetical protein FBZ93_110114 [Bradyrhizobium macuxiense]